jgi:hypothetical protein
MITIPTPAPASPATPTTATAHAAKKRCRRQFYHRFFRALMVSGAVIAVSLFLGILGYHYICGFDWVDAILNASMILTGMGPVGTLTTTAAKLFASAYALFSGVVFITATGILLSPMFHRVLHRFHIEEKDLH